MTRSTWLSVLLLAPFASLILPVHRAAGDAVQCSNPEDAVSAIPVARKFHGLPSRRPGQLPLP